MAEKEQTPVVVTQAEQKGSKGKTIVTVILILIMISLAFYGVSYATSDLGRQKISSFWFSVSTKYNPFYWYGEQIKSAQTVGNIWGTQSNATAEKTGINFKAFESIGGKILPSGAPVALNYKLDVGEGVKDVPLKLKCEFKKTSDKDYKPEAEGQIVESKKFLPVDEPKISSEDLSSYTNILCQVITKKLSEDQIINAKGTIGFPFKQRNSLKVYFTKDATNTGRKFFEQEGLKESYPILAKYSNEPVELGMGTSDENVQPVVIGQNRYPAIGISLKNRWNGRVTKITSMELILPAGIKISKERSGSPNTLCPFDEPVSVGKFVKYSAKTDYLSQLSEFGRGIEKTLEVHQRFFCWLEIEDSILEGKPYNDKEYSVDVSYEYEFVPITETITLKSLEATPSTTPTTPSTGLKYYLCIDQTTSKASCLTSCSSSCQPGCEEFATQAECDSRRGLYQ